MGFVARCKINWLDIQDSEDPQQIYLDTRTGVLSYLSPATDPKYTFQPGAISTSFMHFGEGTEVCVPSPQPGYCNAGPGTVPLAFFSSYIGCVELTDRLCFRKFSICGRVPQCLLVSMP
jgi:hypothetical protein